MPEPDGVPRDRTDAAGGNDGPYVGLRPFRENQRHLIFGRDRDAQLLRQKLYSARLTLLYAPSGVGKTSLLSALVIPSLEVDRDGEEGSVVVSFEQWQAVDPLAALKARIASAAGAIATGPDDDLAQVLAALQQSRGRSIVLVLDQFEQLLIRHPEQVDAIGRELGHALQLAGRCHIVVSLREEFLASLHPLREHIPTLMQSTYRLEHLAGQSARAAITEPAAAFNAEVEPALLSTLVEDLRADVRGAAGVLTVPPPGAVELPFLQLVCKTLWERSDRRTLTLDLYRAKLGGRGGIIQVYLNEVLAGLTPAEQDQAATILHRLAPQSGVKKLYVLDELASETGLPAAAVSAVVDHFARHSVLRTRDTGGATGYELHHDAFTAVLRPWIDARLTAAARRARTWRRVKIGSAALVAAGLAAVFIWPMVQARVRVNDSVSRATESFRKGDEPAAQTTWTNLAGYLVGRNETAKLLELLRENRQLIPHRGTSKDLAEALPEALVAEQAIGQSDAQSDGSSSASVVVSFGVERPLDLVGLHYAWRVGASRLLANSGLPVPIRIDVKRAALKIDQITVRRRGADEKEALTLAVPSRPDHIILLDEDLRLPPAKEALAELRRANPADVEEVLASGTKAQGWYVPYWTVPLWSALGVRTWPEEFGIALAINARVQADAGVLLDPEAVAFLMNRARARFCETVAEAESARGGVQGIRTDLIALLKTGHSIGELPDVLDALAAFPATETSDTVARSLAAAADAAVLPRTPIPRARHIKRVAACTPTETKPPDVPERFRDLLFPRMETEVQVTFGSELFRSLDAEWARNRRAYQQVVTGLRKEIYNGVGVAPPEVAPPKPDRELASRQFSILLPGRARQRVVSDVAPGISQDRVTDLVAPLLQKEMGGNVASFIKAEAVATALGELPTELRTWLRQTYSLTDLKLLLRDFLGAASQDERAKTPERTLSQLPWLLGSMTFWSSACAPRDQTCLVTGLASAQRARIAAAARRDASATGNARSDVTVGINSLLEGGMGKAVERFKAALARDRVAATAAYTTEWAQLARAIQGYELTRSMTTGIPALCQEPKPQPDENAPVTLRAAWEIEDYLDKRQPGVAEEEDGLTLGLCLFRAYVAKEDRAGSEAAWQRLSRAATADVAAWPKAAQFLAGRVLFDAVRLEIIDDKYLADSQRLLAAALSKSDEGERSQSIAGLLEICSNNWRTPRCVAHLQAIEANVSGSFWLPFQLGVSLASVAATQEDAEAALRLIAKAESLLTKEPKSDQERLRAWLMDGRASASSELAREHPEQAVVSRDLNRKLLATLPRPEREGWPARGDAYFGLLLLDVFEGHVDSAQRVFDDWRKETRGLATTRFRLARVFLMIERGDDAGLKDHAREVAHDTTGVDTETLFVASLAAILTSSLDASNEAMVRRYLDSDHEARDAMRLVLYWRLKSQGHDDAAQALIDWRTTRLDPDSWKRRLERGEIDAFSEMMVAYFHGSVQRERIFEGLGSESQYRSTPIGRTSQRYSTTLSQAHFYDALFQATHGDVATRKARMKRELEQVIEIRDVQIWEYYLARYLLRSIGS